ERNRLAPNPGHTGDNLAFTPDGKALVVGPGNGKVHVWDVDLAELRLTIDTDTRERFGRGNTLALSADGKTVALGTGATALRFFDLATGKERAGAAAAHEAGVTA